ncbi:MAG: ComEC/Rec2 family competence protein [bacterium]
MPALWQLIAVLAGIAAAERHIPLLVAGAIPLALRRPDCAVLLALAYCQTTHPVVSVNFALIDVLRPREWALVLGDRIGAGLRPDQARLLASMVLGRGATGLHLRDLASWRDAGMSHLLVASGAQVTLFLAPLSLLLYRGGFGVIGRRIVITLALAQVGLVLCLTGCEPSILRAATMAVWLLVGALLGQPAIALTGLLRTALCWLLLDPGQLHEAGFQLSYLATFGILAASSLRPPDQELTRSWLTTIWRWSCEVLFATWAAQLALLPILWSWFGTIQWPGFLTNIVAVPLGELMLWTALVKAGLWSLGWTPGATWLNSGLGWSLDRLNALAEWGAGLATPQVHRLPGLYALLILATGIALLQVRKSQAPRVEVPVRVEPAIRLIRTPPPSL